MADYLVLTLDVADLDVQTAFWCAALRYEHVGGVAQYRALVDPQGKGPKMLLQQVAEPKQAKNRLHLDLHVADQEGEAARLEAAGATRVQRIDEFGIAWIVMLDPEGNEFCICPT
ncbi:MAG: VOC family protein [Actinomycetota bacterium]|nr:VOC family protein [Actinomycetota bacterium]